ncbi:hypothetical protein MKX01_029153 [Papaver californicum]|nr:hypothetical protein MKX01_029153 [Papaver californicum]
MMEIVEIPCLEDNYSYLIIDETSKEAAVVDPVEPDEIVDFAQQQGLLIKMVLTMHHHWDHAGGNDRIRQMLSGIKVYGGSIDNVRGCTHKLDNRDRLSLGTHINITALHTPCYYVMTKDEDITAVSLGIHWLASQIFTKVCVGKHKTKLTTIMLLGKLLIKNFMSLFYNDGKECCSIMLLVAQKQCHLHDSNICQITENISDNQCYYWTWLLKDLKVAFSNWPLLIVLF